MYGYSAYRTFLGIKLHFDKSKKYDFFRYNEGVTATINSFNKRKDKWMFAKLEKEYKEHVDLVRHIAINAFYGKISIHSLLTNKAFELYNDFIRYEAAITYNFKEDIKRLYDYDLEKFKSLFNATESKHPKIFAMMVSNEINFCTYILLEEAIGLEYHYDDPIWEEYNFRLKKFKPFITYDSEKVRKVLIDVLKINQNDEN